MFCDFRAHARAREGEGGGGAGPWCGCVGWGGGQKVLDFHRLLRLTQAGTASGSPRVQARTRRTRGAARAPLGCPVQPGLAFTLGELGGHPQRSLHGALRVGEPHRPVITVSWFPHERPLPHERRVEQYASFHAFAQALGPPRAYPAKFGIPMFSPAEWAPGVKKTLDGVLRVHFGVLDYDDVPLSDLVQLLARIDVPYVFCSSWSHGDPYKTKLALERMEQHRGSREAAVERMLAGWDGPPNEPPTLIRGRLLVPFSRPVEVSEWRRVWTALARRYSYGQACVDRACSDASHCYFVPAHPQHPPAAPLYVDHSLGRHLWGGLVH